MHRIDWRDLFTAGQAAATAMFELQREGRELSAEELALAWNMSLVGVFLGRISGITPADLGLPNDFSLPDLSTTKS